MGHAIILRQRYHASQFIKGRPCKNERVVPFFAGGIEISNKLSIQLINTDKRIQKEPRPIIKLAMVSII